MEGRRCGLGGGKEVWFRGREVGVVLFEQLCFISLR